MHVTSIGSALVVALAISTTPALAKAPAGPAAGAAPAAAVSAAKGPSLELSLQAAKEALAVCSAKGFNVGVSVLDSAGVAKVVLANDGTSPRGVASSTNKAVTAITFKEPTSQLGEKIKTDTQLADKVSANPNFNARAGGVLLQVNGEIIGAVGVGGAKGSDNDEACALAGVAKINSRLK